MANKRFMSVIMSPYNQSWEMEKTLFSLEKQVGMSPDEYEIIIANTNPEDKLAEDVAHYFWRLYKNVRLIQVHDEKTKLIKVAGYGLNLGVRNYARGDLLVIVIDPARVPTPGVLRKTRDQFEQWGDDIVTTTVPYHFFKHYSDRSFTVEECRKEFAKTRWKQDFYHLFDFAAHTNISKSGIFNESTWTGITKENYLKVGGHNEFFVDWGNNNLDFWRRVIRSKPKDGIQIVGKVNDHWGKVGLGLEIKVLEGEADFHLHHSLSDAKRNFRVLIDFRRKIWEEYAKLGECIVANITRPNWGQGKAEEITYN